jgi:phage shock protein PspC (stress-responsive transcriptional regulator)
MCGPGAATHSGAMNTSLPLHRATSGRMAAGVAAGLANYFGVDVTIVRICFVLATFLGGGLGILAYVACLLLIPEEGADQSIASSMINSIQGGR